MKIFATTLLALFTSQVSFGACNVDLAFTAGRYVMELEKAKLQNMQESPCKVFNAEFKTCDEWQTSVLFTSLPIAEIFGNYCMSHAPAPTQYEDTNP